MEDAVPDRHAEFSLGPVRYRYEGPAVRGWAFSSTDASGENHLFFIYQSNSEGGWRSSQGVYIYNDPEEGPSLRYLKGNLSGDPAAQYTQDTQLHPDFADQVALILQNDHQPDDPRVRATYDRVYRELSARLDYGPDTQRARAAGEDFGRFVTRVPLGNSELDATLRQLGTGDWRLESMAEVVGLPASDPDTVWEAYQQRIQGLNDQLRTAGVIPDFRAEPHESFDSPHPTLGRCYTEVFLGERGYEWHMRRDLRGNVWIDRIRLTNAGPTPYGTDNRVVTSGVLTTKPGEYTGRLDGIPEAERPRWPDTNYSSMASLLGRLLPIQLYKQTYPARRGRFEDRPVADR